MKGRKLERPFKLDLDFGEALARFAQADPEEVKQLQSSTPEAGEKPDTSANASSRSVDVDPKTTTITQAK